VGAVDDDTGSDVYRGLPVVLVVDVANVMGSRPDGWWRDRPGAAGRLLASLVPLVSADVISAGGAEGLQVHIERIIAVVEGRARSATAPPELEVVLAPADGDSAIVEVAQGVRAARQVPLVVTADRGLRERLPSGSRVGGPGWLLGLL
jgi:hypothetical protein